MYRRKRDRSIHSFKQDYEKSILKKKKTEQKRDCYDQKICNDRLHGIFIWWVFFFLRSWKISSLINWVNLKTFERHWRFTKQIVGGFRSGGFAVIIHFVVCAAPLNFHHNGRWKWFFFYQQASFCRKICIAENSTIIKFCYHSLLHGIERSGWTQSTLISNASIWDFVFRWITGKIVFHNSEPCHDRDTFRCIIHENFSRTFQLIFFLVPRASTP